MARPRFEGAVTTPEAGGEIDDRSIAPAPMRPDRGQAWLLAINVVAVAVFLELTAVPSAFAIVFSLLDAIVLMALIRHRAWFGWRAEDAVVLEAGGT